MSEPQGSARGREAQKLSDIVRDLLEEARMILPGTQTLFGFQLIVVFNAQFQDRLSPTEQAIHLAATMLVALATAMLIAPVAYHRWVEPDAESRRFVSLATQLLRWSLLPLMIAICADISLVALLVTGQPRVSLLCALVTLAIFGGLWFVWPLRARKASQR